MEVDDKLSRKYSPLIIIWVFAILIVAISSQFAAYRWGFMRHPLYYGPIILILVPFLFWMFEDKEEVSPYLNFQIITVTALLFLLVIGITLAPYFQGELGINIIIPICFFLIPWLIIRGDYSLSLEDLGFSRPDKDLIIKTALISVFCSLILLLFFGIPEFLGAYYFAWDYGIRRWDLLVPAILILSIMLLLFNAIPEEFMFRSLLQTSLVERIGRQRGIILSSVFFGFLHIPAILPYVYVSIVVGSIDFIAALMIAFLFQTQAGIVFGIAYDRTRNLLLPVSLHVVYNLVLLAPLFWIQLTMLS